MFQELLETRYGFVFYELKCHVVALEHWSRETLNSAKERGSNV